MVTGSGGFIGSHLVESLLEKGYEVDCLLKPDENVRWIKDPDTTGPRSLRGLYVMFKIVNSGFQLLLGKSETNLGFVKDIVNGMILSAENPIAVGQIYFLMEDRIYNSRELFMHIADALGKKTMKIRVPYFLLYSLAFLIEKLADITGTHAPLRRDSLSAYLNSNWRFSMNKAKKELNFKAEFLLAKGLKNTANWYKEERFR